MLGTPTSSNRSGGRFSSPTTLAKVRAPISLISNPGKLWCSRYRLSAVRTSSSSARGAGSGVGASTRPFVARSSSSSRSASSRVLPAVRRIRLPPTRISTYQTPGRISVSGDGREEGGSSWFRFSSRVRTGPPFAGAISSVAADPGDPPSNRITAIHRTDAGVDPELIESFRASTCSTGSPPNLVITSPGESMRAALVSTAVTTSRSSIQLASNGSPAIGRQGCWFAVACASRSSAINRFRVSSNSRASCSGAARSSARVNAPLQSTGATSK